MSAQPNAIPLAKMSDVNAEASFVESEASQITRLRAEIDALRAAGNSLLDLLLRKPPEGPNQYHRGTVIQAAIAVIGDTVADQ